MRKFMLIIGERINTSRKLINESVANRDAVYIQEDVRSQIDSGADLINVNAGSRRNSEVEDLFWLIEVIQKSLPQVRLCIDSPNQESMKAVLDQVEHPPMLNSITGERSRFEAMAPIIQFRECDIVALCIDDRGIPKSADQALENAVRLVSDLERLGVKRERIYLDPFVQAVSASQTEVLLRAMSYRTGQMWVSKFSAAIGCAWTYIYPYLTGELNYSITGLGHGMKRRNLFPEGRQIISIPFDIFSSLLQTLQDMPWVLPAYKPDGQEFVRRVLIDLGLATPV